MKMKMKMKKKMKMIGYIRQERSLQGRIPFFLGKDQQTMRIENIKDSDIENKR